MNRRSAFTLIETLVAGAILCVVLFLVISLYPSSMLGMKQGREVIAATNLAQRIMEEKRAGDFDDLADESMQVTEDGLKFTYEFTVTDGLASTDRNGMSAVEVKNLTIVVRWDSRTGKDRNLTLETRVFHFRNP